MVLLLGQRSGIVRSQRSLRRLKFFAASLALFSIQALRADEASSKGLETLSVRRFTDLKAVASSLAKQDFRPLPPLPQPLREINYDTYKMISFRPDQAIWMNDKHPFWLEFFHPGYVHADQVKIELIEQEGNRELALTKNLFEYRSRAKDLQITEGLGFAGFRIVEPWNDLSKRQEYIVFLGASYFRARCAQSVYGTSVRGLALDTGLNKAEEFPIFRQFWIDEPQPDDKQLTAFGLLDSPSVVGAYQFTMRPGDDRTTFDVDATLFFRKPVERVGLAPLTSMWLWGDSLEAPEQEYRPEVHDADGLLIADTEGGWHWRALSQQTYPSVVRLDHGVVKGFGLIQRDQNFEHYRDREANYDKRPSVWVEPKGNWPAGAVELLEMPAPHEGIDNTAAWWNPGAELSQSHEPLNVQYQVAYFRGDPAGHAMAKAVAYRVNRRAEPAMKFDIDFEPAAGGELGDSAVDIDIQTVRAELQHKSLRRSADGIWTASVDVRPTSPDPVGLQVTLRQYGKNVSEVWSCLTPVTPPVVSLPPWRLKELSQGGAK